jgi:hypothetical protein
MPIKGDNDVSAARTFFDCDVSAFDVLVQIGPTLLYSYDIHNVSAADAFVQLFDAASIVDVIVGTTVPDYVVPLAANGIRALAFSKPLSFPLGLVIASTTTSGGNTGAAQDISLGFA